MKSKVTGETGRQEGATYYTNDAWEMGVQGVVVQLRNRSRGNDGRVLILIRCSGYPFHSARRAVISTDLQPFIDAILMEEVLAGHDTEVVLGFVVVQTYQAPVYAVGSYPTLVSVLWDVC